MIALVLAVVTLLPMTALAEPVSDSKTVQALSARTEPLTISEVLARIELTHPLLRAMGAERAEGSGEDPEGARGLGTAGQELYTGRAVYDLESHDGLRHSESTYGRICRQHPPGWASLGLRRRRRTPQRFRGFRHE